MRLARIGPAGAERPAVQAGQRWYDLSGLTHDLDGAFLAAGFPGVREALDAGSLPELPAGRFGPPVAAGQDRLHRAELPRPRRRDRRAGAGRAGPVHEGRRHGRRPDDEVLVPRGSTKTDYEVELAVVIGRDGPLPRQRRTRPPRCIAGYAISHDVSEREFQLERGGQWDKGKNCETFNPLGPVAGHRRRGGRPAGARPAAVGQRRAPPGRQHHGHDLRRRPPGLVPEPVHGAAARRRDQHRHPGRGRPGPPGRSPYLRAGDVVELEIDGLGRQRQRSGQA